MKKIESGDPERLVFRDDWGWFWRTVGWCIVALGCLCALGVLLPKPPATAASTQPTTQAAVVAEATQPADATQPAEAASEDGEKQEKEEPGMALVAVIFGLAGWCLYRRWIVLDRRQGTIHIRRGVGLLAWRTTRRMDEFDQIVISRHVSRGRNRHVYYEVEARGKNGSMTIATLDCDLLFDSSREGRAFSFTVAKFCGYERVQDSSMMRSGTGLT